MNTPTGMEQGLTDTGKSPEDLRIHPRNIRFHTQLGRERWWLNGDPLATAIFNALSVTFPEGERRFIESVLRYRDSVGEPLKSQIMAFARQEANHTREHMAFNAHVVEAGYDISRIEVRTKKRTDYARSKSPLIQLAATSALEHFTAILAHQVLTDPSLFAGAPPEIERLWRWHSVEEIEHKAVAFDTFQAAARGMLPLRRWIIRILVMTIVTWQFSRSMIANVADLLSQDGFEPRRLRGLALSYLFVRPGLLRRALPHYLSYFAPGFHPWQCDDRALVRAGDLEPADMVAV